MLTEICAELKNYFIDPNKDIYAGDYTISDGSIDLPFLLEGQYFRIVGSALNNGVWQYPAHQLQDEVFSGAVWAMRVPPSLIALAAEIEAWKDKYSAAANSPYSSESVNASGYSRTKAAGDSVGKLTWQNIFNDRLRPWRKL